MSDVFEKKGWAVPNFKTNEFTKKGTKYCVCIPIINEGERIISQLKKMKNAGVMSSLDVIICDGGSTDGSTHVDMLKEFSVNTLLVKDDSGVIGAQLRMGYAFALERGYDGIITMDGNDKDGPEVLFKFVEKLDQGYDYIQGSRYIKGGKGINTPAIRDFAIRLIHAPIINFSSGYKFTDTTNGNRAYSRRLLESDLIKPFRDIFIYYDFLVFISSVAYRYGFRVVEVPMTRSYPKGKVPTKISFFKGNLRILKSLLNVITGKYLTKENK